MYSNFCVCYDMKVNLIFIGMLFLSCKALWAQFLTGIQRYINNQFIIIIKRTGTNRHFKKTQKTPTIYSPGLEPRTFLAWGGRVNQYTTNLTFSVKEQCKWNARAIVGHPSTTFACQPLTVFSWPERGSFVMLCCTYLQLLASHGPTMKRIIYIDRL